MVECGGAYIKLLTKDTQNDHVFDNFNSKTNYSVMFGPDRCGNTDKVHFIFNHLNKRTNKTEEKSFKETINTHTGRFSTLYTLIVRPDNTFKIMINMEDMKITNDNVDKTVFSLFEDIEPPVIPPKEIDVEEADVNNEPKMIDNPDSQRPETWNEEEDGEWIRPKIVNPNYRKQKTKKIPNPEYYEDKTPYMFSEMAGIGFELWTMQGEVLFDNIFVGTSEEIAHEIALKTWKTKNDMENEQMKDEHAKSIKKQKFEWTLSNVVDTLQFELESFVFSLIDDPKNFIIEKYYIFIAILLVVISTFYMFIKLSFKNASQSANKDSDPKAKQEKPTNDNAQ